MNRRSRNRLDDATLAAEIYQKAVFLKNTPREDAVYLRSKGSRAEALVFTPGRPGSPQTSVVFVKVEEGWLGYVGDVSAEVESQAIILAMCGL